MATKFHDVEFGPEILRILRKRDILGDANPALLVPLRYYQLTRADYLEQQFQLERKEDPLLETTPAEAWLASTLLPDIRQIRANVVIPERMLSKALQKYLLHSSPSMLARPSEDNEQTLTTTVTPLIPAVRSLLVALIDRRKSLFGILAIRPKSGSIHETAVFAQPKTLRDKIIAQGIKECWSNQHLARMLDGGAVKPRNPRWKSYREMLHDDSGQFYVLKSTVKKRYLIKAN